jgi:hypothetical protein
MAAAGIPLGTWRSKRFPRAGVQSHRGCSLDSQRIVKDRLCGALHAAHAETLTWMIRFERRAHGDTDLAGRV